MVSVNETIDIIKRGTGEIIDEAELRKKLEQSKTLTVKAGFDPTAPDLHLGHTVLLNKMKQLQDLGHTIVFLIGDFTAMIGDPSGRNVTRMPLSKENILTNTQTYKDQVFKILDPKKTKVEFNSKWFSSLNAQELIGLAATQTVARMLERDDFHKRFKEEQPISIHEFLYPILQGYDSVMLKADIELGGTDQKFNLLMGRHLQKHFNQEPQVIITLPLIEGLDGVKKMSKSYKNYIAIQESPDEMFGKLMSISDELMWKYVDVLSFKSKDEIEAWKKDVKNGKNPKDIKIIFAKEIVERFHNEAIAHDAHQAFERRFKERLLPENIPEFKVILKEKDNTVTIVAIKNNKSEIVMEPLDSFQATHLMNIPLPNILKSIGLALSTSKAIQLIKGGAVRVDDNKIENEKEKLALTPDRRYLIKVGRQLAGLTIEKG